MTAQTKELTSLAQKVATETAEPIKEGVAKVFKKRPDRAQPYRLFIP